MVETNAQKCWSQKNGKCKIFHLGKLEPYGNELPLKHSDTAGLASEYLERKTRCGPRALKVAIPDVLEGTS